MADDETLFLAREFLNNEGFHTDATIFAEVSKVDYQPILKISDCFHKITLWHEYDPTSEASCANALDKADRVIKIVTEFRAAMAEAMAYHKEHPLPVKPRNRGRRGKLAPRPR